MVQSSNIAEILYKPAFQYSLCRVVLMVLYVREHRSVPFTLSVLALSSRFDGPSQLHVYFWPSPVLSVLALSSRFDGPATVSFHCRRLGFFQYSLCRVVLMVR